MTVFKVNRSTWNRFHMTKYYYFYITLVSIVLRTVSAVISLQLPGLTYATGTPTTVDVEFLDADSNPLYTLVGEVFVQSLPMQANNIYIPDKLTGTQKYVSKIRIKAGESGMILKLFDESTSTVPKLIVMMKAGFLASAATKQPIEIDFLGADDRQSINEAEIFWFNRNLMEFTRLKGMHVGKLEVHVERVENAPLVPVKTFGVVSLQSNEIIMPEAMNAAIRGSSLIPSQNAVYMPAGSNGPPSVYLNSPPGVPFAQSNSQFPNAPPLLYYQQQLKQ